MTTNSTGNKPEKRFSSGAVSATIWNNVGQSKTGEATEYKTVTLQRSYTDKDGKWQATNSFRVSDLPRAQLVLQKAYEYLALRDDSDSPTPAEATPPGQIAEEVVM